MNSFARNRASLTEGPGPTRGNNGTHALMYARESFFGSDEFTARDNQRSLSGEIE